MSAFTTSCKAAALGGWAATASWPARYENWKRGPSLGGRAQRGCLGFLIFGVVYVFVPLMVLFMIEMVLITYALIASALWGAGAAVDGITGSRPAAGGPKT
jgi:hypothetical protein